VPAELHSVHRTPIHCTSVLPFARVNMFNLSILNQFRFSFVFWGCQKSVLITIAYLRLLLVASLLILGYDATASSDMSKILYTINDF